MKGITNNCERSVKKMKNNFKTMEILACPVRCCYQAAWDHWKPLGSNKIVARQEIIGKRLRASRGLD